MSEPDSEPAPAERSETDDERVPLSPGLVILAIVAILLGVFSALVMSASAL
jgi:hypothetical protein